MSAISVIHADSLEYLKTLPDNSLHACVTDPPYGLGEPPDPTEVLAHWAQTGDWAPTGKGKKFGFMGQHWDAFVPGVALWREVFRVLRPGSHVAAFAGTRTWDWMSLGMRFGGFQLVDTLMWLYGEGWAKGGKVDKRIDKSLGLERESLGPHENQTCVYLKRGEECQCSEDGERAQSARTKHQPMSLPASEEAMAWDDCGTSLKPGWEPILLFRKPWEQNSALNCMKWGTGALRTGPCRIEGGIKQVSAGSPSYSRGTYAEKAYVKGTGAKFTTEGRWPANLLFAHAYGCTEGGCVPDCPVRRLDEQVGWLHAAGNKDKARRHFKGNKAEHHLFPNYDGNVQQYDNGGFPSRFYYCAKANDMDQNEGLLRGMVNTHPTIKPTALMRWLVRLLCPPWGTLLDPFAGSGTTGKAAALEGLSALLIEREEEFWKIAQTRVNHFQRKRQDEQDGRFPWDQE